MRDGVSRLSAPIDAITGKFRGPKWHASWAALRQCAKDCWTRVTALGSKLTLAFPLRGGPSPVHTISRGIPSAGRRTCQLPRQAGRPSSAIGNDAPPAFTLELTALSMAQSAAAPGTWLSTLTLESGDRIRS